MSACPHPLLSKAPGGCPVCPRAPLWPLTPDPISSDMATPYLSKKGKLRVPRRAPSRYVPTPEVKEIERRAREQPSSTVLDGKAASELLQRARAERSRRSLAEFIRNGWHVLHPGEKLRWSWHMEVVADHVQAMLEDLIRARTDETFTQRTRNLLINIPPRSAKTMIVSVFAPVWAWLHDPTLKIRCISGNPRVTNNSSRASRDLIDSSWFKEWFTPKWSIRSDADGIEFYKNSARGERHSSTFNAKITGEGTDVIIVDDPHDAKEVMSDVLREAVLEKWDGSIRNRVNDGMRCVRIGVMQRLHQEDWSGHVLGKHAEGVGSWEHVLTPQEYECVPACTCASCSRGHSFLGWKDPRTDEGELLHPDRFPAEFLETEKIELGSYGYAGQHQQRPAPADGGMFKKAWWRFWKPDGTEAPAAPRPRGCYEGPARALPALDWIVVSIDATFGKSTTSDYVGALVIGGSKADRFVLHNATRRLTFTETTALIRSLVAMFPKCTRVLVEKKANGDAILDVLGSEIPGLIAINPEGGKESRAAAITPACEAGNVYLLDGAPWLESFIGEFAIFPNGRHDDQVDALSQALIEMTKSVDVMRARMLSTW